MVATDQFDAIQTLLGSNLILRIDNYEFTYPEEFQQVSALIVN